MEERVKRTEERLDDVDGWRKRVDEQLDSAERQRRKLFSIVGDHVKASKESNEQTHKMLGEQAKLSNQILARLDAADKKDAEHDDAIATANKEREELRLKTVVAEATDEHLKSKGLPASGKKLYGCMATMVAIGSLVGPFVLDVLEHLPKIVESIKKIL